MQGERVGVAGLAARVLGALALVYGTYNPEGISFFHWTILPLVRGEGVSSLGAGKVVVGILLLSAGPSSSRPPGGRWASSARDWCSPSAGH